MGALITKLFGKADISEFRSINVGNLLGEGKPVHPELLFPDNRVLTSKYTTWNFAPKNLFEQFRRIANFYFLCIGIIQIILEVVDDTPTSPFTSWAPLVFVITVTAVKQGYEDMLRHRADNDVNRRPFTVIRNGQTFTSLSKDIRVGDIVKVPRNVNFPCDLVLVSSAEVGGECYIMTANLDGETNLKTHTCTTGTMSYLTPEAIQKLDAIIECQHPHTDLYKFSGRLKLSDGGPVSTYALGHENVLLRGAQLRNTDYVYGCAIYTGQDTKMARNSKLKTTKFSQVEKRMNVFLILYLSFLLIENLVLVLLKRLYTNQADAVSMKYWGITLENQNFVFDFLSFLVLTNYVIPISLYVTMEVQKFSGTFFFEWDLEMYDADTGLCAKANTSDLNEELGQVQYLFTDKTGTLTENEMRFKHCSANGVWYTDTGGMLGQQMSNPDLPYIRLQLSQYPIELERMLVALSLCHTVRIECQRCHDAGQRPSVSTCSHYIYDWEYSASSPDEKAFVEACRKFGIIFSGTERQSVFLRYDGRLRQYQLLTVFDFDADRKRMSVVVREVGDEGKIMLLTKGADSAIMPRCTTGCSLDATQCHVNKFASLGLRTMCVASKVLSLHQWTQLEQDMLSARGDIGAREEKLSSLYNETENGLELLGATAVEDLLQEGVPETLHALREAGIKVWVLTGDKIETAVNISLASNHFTPSMQQLHLTHITSNEEAIARVNTFNKTLFDKPHKNYCAVIDGQSLSHIAMETGDFLKLCQRVATVLCCRMSPLQKALIVRMVKMGPGRPVTCAIGDGANDVSMIQEAHVGLGIMGKEGRSAVRCSDYAFSRFRFVRRALLLHGHYYYTRLSVLVQYFFYKNIAFVLSQTYYSFFNLFSAQTLFESFYLMMYNVTFTSMPILFFGLFEQTIDSNLLLQRPALYKLISKNSRLSGSEFFKWNLLGVWHSLCSFGVPLLAISLKEHDLGIDMNGWMYDNYAFGVVVFTAAVLIVNLKLPVETYYLPWMTHAVFWFTVIMYFIQIGVGYDLFACELLDGPAFGLECGMNFARVFTSPSVWVTLLMTIALALLPDCVLRARRDVNWRLQLRPNPLLEQEIYRPDVSMISFNRVAAKSPDSRLSGTSVL